MDRPLIENNTNLLAISLQSTVPSMAEMFLQGSVSKMNPVLISLADLPGVYTTGIRLCQQPVLNWVMGAQVFPRAHVPRVAFIQLP